MVWQGTPRSWEGHESVLDPAGTAAATIHLFWRYMLVVSTITYVAVIAFLIYALVKARRGRDERAEPERQRTMTRGVTVAAGATVVTLFLFLVHDFMVGRAIAAPMAAKDALRVEIVGHQWWWDVTYEDTAVHGRVTTANEIHVPVGRPVLFKVSSRDVIHSFWIPNLNGKQDLIPGHQAVAWFRADVPGVYRGQCAEFCGLQHAKMALVVTAEPPDTYRAWYNRQLAPASVPSDSSARHGQDVFLSSGCGLCHSIEGTPAGSHVGPDLTHLASRMTLAAGVLPNNRGNLAGWIVDPQRIKPGSRMPPNNLPPKDLQALLDYLQGLK